jgi:hypothetical protein
MSQGGEGMETAGGAPTPSCVAVREKSAWIVAATRFDPKKWGPPTCSIEPVRVWEVASE